MDSCVSLTDEVFVDEKGGVHVDVQRDVVLVIFAFHFSFATAEGIKGQGAVVEAVVELARILLLSVEVERVGERDGVVGVFGDVDDGFHGGDVLHVSFSLFGFG